MADVKTQFKELLANAVNEIIKEKNLEDKIQLIRGIEVNTLYNDYEVHILGYFMNPENSDFQNLIKVQQQARIKQTKEILHLLKIRMNHPPKSIFRNQNQDLH